jgi:bifunctional DNase/RNase
VVLLLSGWFWEEARRWRLREVAMTTATDVGFVEMRIAKVVGFGAAQDEVVQCVVLDEVAGDRHLPILIGQAEAFTLSPRLGGAWRGPMTYQFAAALVQALGGRVRQVHIDGVVEELYTATVEVEGPLGRRSVEARPSDALNLAVLVDAPIFAAPEVLREAEARRAVFAAAEVLGDAAARRADDAAKSVLLREALVASPMTVDTVWM